MTSTLSFIHFDTQDTIAKKSPFNCTFQLSTAIKNIYKVYLKYVELPVGWYNMREDEMFQVLISNYPNVLSMPRADLDRYFSMFDISEIAFIGSSQFYAVPINLIIPAGIYSVETMITTINDKIELFLTSCHQFNSNFNIGKVRALSIPVSGDYSLNATIKFNGNNFGIVIGPSNLMTNILGFDPYQTGYDGKITAPRLYRLFQDTYLNLYFPNVPHNNTNFNNKFCSFKIPISTGFQTVLYSGDSREFAQHIVITDPNYVMNSLTIQMFDRNGKEIDSGTLYDWSFTLGFEILEQPRNLLTFVQPEPIRK